MVSSALKIAVSGYYGFNNFGDEAILKTLVQELRAFPVDITVFSKNPALTSALLSVSAVYTFDLLGVFKTLKNSDVLISGGGSLLQDSTSLKSLFYYLGVILIALFFRKKVVIFAQGIGPIKNLLGRFFTRFVLKNCSYITVRDEKSLFRVRGWGAKADLVNDPVWSIKLPDYSPVGRVGVQLRAWRSLSPKFLFSLARCVASNFSNNEIYIYSFQDSLDLEVCKSFENNLKLANPSIKTKIISNISIDEVVESFSSLDYLIGMRYHACLLALKYGIKTLGLCYDEKVEKLAKRFDIPYSDLSLMDNLDEKFDKLKKLDSKTILERANSTCFDFSGILNSLELKLGLLKNHYIFVFEYIKTTI